MPRRDPPAAATPPARHRPQRWPRDSFCVPCAARNCRRRGRPRRRYAPSFAALGAPGQGLSRPFRIAQWTPSDRFGLPWMIHSRPAHEHHGRATLTSGGVADRNNPLILPCFVAMRRSTRRRGWLADVVFRPCPISRGTRASQLETVDEGRFSGAAYNRRSDARQPGDC
jgi:hypothetical protein